MEGRLDESSSVGVAVRVRPLNNKEINESPGICVTANSNDKIITIGADRIFTFDQVFGIDSTQEQIFNGCAKDLVQRVFKGYNATILAYGQTGSGKTFTMGSGQLASIKPEDIGIIPRVITMIFQEIENRKSEADFIVKVDFIEIYNEEIHDLLNTGPCKNLVIREKDGSIGVDGITEVIVKDSQSMFDCLENGTLQRSVSSTLMNSQSSRSHAIFTININREPIQDSENSEKWMAKFHFVDLAGSERAKRTGASGATLKEGISINKGLLCLGNVISALTDESKKVSHIPYRDSKLTRILQDSLGGNSNTFMIACISPAEINFEETLNSLKYASRARHIKNKPVVNTDAHSAMISQMRLEISNLKLEIQTYQNLLSTSNNDDIKNALEILKKESKVVQISADDIEMSSHKSQQMEKKISMLSSELEISRSSLQALEIENLKIKRDRDMLKIRIEKYVDVLRVNGIDMLEEDETAGKLVDEYLDTIEKLKKDKDNKEIIIKDLEYEYRNLIKELERDRKILASKTQEIEKFKFKGKENNENIEDIINKNVDDYGRVFAETVFATLEKKDNESEISTEIPGDLEIKESLNIQKQEIIEAEEKIKEKEEKIKNIEEAFKEMQNKLLEEMSNQYYKKIQELQIEMRNTEKERDYALEKVKEKSSGEQKTVADKFKSKIQALEQQLQENLKKDRELSNLHKTLDNQKSQLFKLDEEIRKEKKQKLDLQKKFKEEKETFIKLKAQRQKEILLMKRTGAKKDQEIKILKTENKKKEIIARRKTEELAAMQKRQRDIALKRKSSGNMIGTETLKDWIKQYIKACIEEKKLSEALKAEIDERENLEDDVKDLYQTLTDIKLKLERNELILSDHEPNIDLDELYNKIQIGKRESQEISDEIEILEEKINFKHNKIIEYSNKLANSKVEEIKSWVNMSSLENLQNLIKVLFDKILEKSEKIKDAKKKIKIKTSEIEDQGKILTQTTTEKDLLKKNFEIDIERLQTEIHEKNCYIKKIIEDTGKKDQDFIENPDKDEEIKKLKDRLESYVNKYNKLCRVYNEIKDNEYDKSKPRSSVNNYSLNKAREIQKKKKVLEAEIQDEQEGPRIPAIFPLGRISLSNKSLTTEEDVFDRLQRSSTMPKTRGSIIPESRNKLTQKWGQLISVEAHEGPISSMFVSESMLYTASNQKFRIWSLENFSYIGEVSAHNSLIRSMAYWPEKSSFFTGCGGIVNQYDTLTLNKVATFKGHTDEIRVMKIENNLLYSAGKGNPYSIVVWDPRKFDSPVQEKEKGLEVFSLLIEKDIMYYGCRDHKVHRMRLSDYEVLKSYETSHYDTVTSLTLYENTLISGSRDKNLRVWDQNGEHEIKTILSAHTDWINCLGTDNLQRSIYSGGKEGRIRVWKGSTEINYIGEMIGHSGSVNCITPMHFPQQTLISASSDRTFRIWRLSEDYSEDSITY